VKGDEERVVAAFCAWLEAAGWSVEREVQWCDVVAVRDGVTMWCEAKGRTYDPGLDCDLLYGQLLRRVPAEGAYRIGVVVPSSAVKAARRVVPRVRQAINLAIFEVSESNQVRELAEDDEPWPSTRPARPDAASASGDSTSLALPDRLGPAPEHQPSL
jgi:hypothetical protein